ncbi:ATP-dependent DNA helicase Q1-like [Argiope bruennichi]|uniref:ATP-dependent DNA helicase n=1 Tax=Argiope bruennichi TaxID=94029 RepID=A0A8T0F4M5_ARGBR|nr:ATP-dependent DNA helicase Q1-like [Argiope bruennichi]KAF8786156.1 ATP-dependent DNA helicase Q1 like protein [Argiope bruennichi]
MSAELEAELEKITKEISLIDKAIDRLSKKKQALISKKSAINRQISEKASEELANQDWERSDHPWSNKVKEVLKSKFKLDKFRPHQLSTINAVMSGQDCILLMPTGGGKSLCYQLPAMVLNGITLVVSPLVSLMEDQIMAMESLNLPATLLNASSTRETVNHVHKEMTSKDPSIKLLYVTPEKLAKSKRFMSKLEKMYQMGQFSLLAIDEVHCCSQWGHDFRPDYKFLGIMKRQFPKVPILGLTATATTSIIQDIQSILSMKGCLVLKASFNRPNLKYEVVCKSSCQKDNVSELEDLLKNRFNGLSGIIYCFSVKDCEEIASELRKRGVKAKAYHAQLDANNRSSVHKSWTSNSTQVIVATVAFGMGIDKPDVRFVIHHSLPKSMENFYQESGRAGRDDHPASCILFYRFADVFRQSTMVFTEQKGLDNLYGMVAYCLDLSRCRRSLIAQHFDERWNTQDCNKMCDHCEQKGFYEEKLKNIAREYRSIFNILEHASMIEERLTSQKLIEAWQGKGPPKLRPPGHLSTTYSRETCERIIALLLLESYLKEEFHFTPYSTISYINIGTRRLSNDQELLFPMSVVRVKNDDGKSGTSSTKHIKSSESSSAAKESSSNKQSQTKKSPPSLSSSSSSAAAAAASSTTKEKDLKTSKTNAQLNENSQLQNGLTSKQKPDASSDLTIASTRKRPRNCVLSSDEDDVRGIKKQIVDVEKSGQAITICDESDEDEMKFDDFDIFPKKKKSVEGKKVPMIVVSDSD